MELDEIPVNDTFQVFIKLLMTINEHATYSSDGKIISSSGETDLYSYYMYMAQPVLQ